MMSRYPSYIRPCTRIDAVAETFEGVVPNFTPVGYGL